jgi:glycosyltransferase involved in cell wall biosynthesis
MTQPQVSVCVTTCNQQRYVRQCLESVLAQTPDVDLEILVGDDCSDDGTTEIVAEMAEEHKHVISHVRHSPRIGASANMQALLSRAKGRFIARLDGDDYWLPGKLKPQVAYLAANPDCAAVYTNALTVDEAGNPIGIFNDVGDECFDLGAMLRRGNFLNNSSVMSRAGGKSAWIELQGPLIDYRVHLLHARSGFLAQLAQPLTVYRINSSGSMVASSNDRVRQLYWEAIGSVPRNLVTENDLACGLADFLKRVVFRAIRTSRWELLEQWAPQVFAASPYGSIRTGFLLACAIVRTTLIEFRGRFRRGPDGHRLRVLYRR